MYNVISSSEDAVYGEVVDPTPTKLEQNISVFPAHDIYDVVEDTQNAIYDVADVNNVQNFGKRSSLLVYSSCKQQIVLIFLYLFKAQTPSVIVLHELLLDGHLQDIAHSLSLHDIDETRNL